jgi:hypothetical protein
LGSDQVSRLSDLLKGHKEQLIDAWTTAVGTLPRGRLGQAEPLELFTPVVKLWEGVVGRTLATIASISRVPDAETVVVGIRPAVAITLVELGLSLPGIRTALNVELGMGRLARERGEVAGEDETETRTVPAP